MNIKAKEGAYTGRRGAWSAPCWLTGSFTVCVLAVATVAAGKLIPNPIGEVERARRALEAEELPRQPAMVFALPARDGKTLDFAQFKGKVVLVTFWTSWCPPCRAEEPSLRELATMFSRNSFQLLAVSADDGWDAVDKFFAGRKPPYSVVLDRGAVVSRSWGTTRFPESYLVDASGKLRLKFAGPRDWTDLDVLTLLQGLGARRVL